MIAALLVFGMRISIVLGLLVAAASCSIGDRRPEYRECVSKCTLNDSNVVNHTAAKHCNPVPWDMWLFGWTVEYCCRYECMMEPQAPKNVQYFGKWPFTRLLGIQVR